jgi:phosphohistidine phosphatase
MRLTVLRHGLAESTSRGGDFTRELLPRGIQQARLAGQSLTALNPRPDRVLVSPASRTLHTAQCALEELALPSECLQLEPRLYLASLDTLLDLVDLLDADDTRDSHDVPATHVLIVGHNPGLSELALRLGETLPTGELGTGEWRSVELVTSARSHDHSQKP